MSDILKPRILQENAVYWAPAGSDDMGRPAYAAPVVIDCRWEDTNDEFVDKEGRVQVSKAMVYVDRGLELHGVLKYLGRKASNPGLAGLTDQTQPFNNPNAWEVRGVNNLPNRRAKKFLRWVYL
jgi:hypothetical protein